MEPCWLGRQRRDNVLPDHTREEQRDITTDQTCQTGLHKTSSIISPLVYNYSFKTTPNITDYIYHPQLLIPHGIYQGLKT